MTTLFRKEQYIYGPRMPLLNSGNWNPALHPRNSIGEFIYTDGGLHGRSPSGPTKTAGTSALHNALSKLKIDTTYKYNGKVDPHGIYITHYGPNPKVGGWDFPGDSETDKGIGNDNNQLNSLSLAVSKDIVKAAGLTLGRPVYINGQYIGNYDDTPGEDGRVDIYDHENSVGRNWGGMVWGGTVTNHP
jgi:hypothetical protein